mgnify:FL=1
MLRKKNGVENCIKIKEKDYKGMHYLPRSGVAISLIVAFIISDFCFISQLIEYYFVDEVWRSVLASAVIAIFVDVSPSILAACVMVKKKSKGHYCSIVGILLTLIIIFCSLAYVRLHSVDLIFSISSTSLGSTMNQTADTALTAGQLGMGWLFVFLPIATSVLSFIISIMSDGTGKTYKEKMAANDLYDLETLSKIKVLELRHVINRDFDGLVNDLEDLEMDDKKMDALILKNELRLKQAMLASDPQTTDNIFAKNEGEGGEKNE